MIYGIGIDIIDINRIEQAIEKYGERFLNRIFTENEKKYCESFNDTKFLHYAARFCAKESFSKAIGTGITQGFKFKEISVENIDSGQPFIILDGELKSKWSSYNIYISLSHTDTTAVAVVIMEK